MTKRKFIIDADPGLDDAISILYLLAQKDIEVVAITTVAGNTYKTQAAFNAGIVLAAAKQLNIPIYQGTKCNLLGEIRDSDDYFGNNGFGDLYLPLTPVMPSKTMLSHEALLHYSHKYPYQLNILAIGPLTNLGLAYIIDNSFDSRINSLYALGANRVKTTVDNVTIHSEFNSFFDPVATKIVLQNFKLFEEKTIVLIDWAFCVNYPVSNDFFEKIGESILKNTGNTNIASIFKAKPPSVASSTDVRAVMKIADQYAAYIAVNPHEIEKYTIANLGNIYLEGPKRGKTCLCETENGNILLVDEINFMDFYKNFTSAFENFRFPV